MKNFDSIFDDVVVNVKAAASVVSKKASTVYDASKHKISAESLKRAINKKLIELGKLTYKATVEHVDLAEEIAKTVEEIRELKENLDIVTAHIASIRNQKICPDCGAKVPKASLFCNICGAKFEVPVNEVTEEPAQEEQSPIDELTEDDIEDITVAVQNSETVDEMIAEEAEKVCEAAEKKEEVGNEAEESAE